MSDQQSSPSEAAQPSVSHLETLVQEWLSVPEVAERQGCSLSTVRTQIKDRQLVSVRRGENDAVYVPAVFVTEEGPLPTLSGTVHVLADGGMNDLELLVWLFTAQEGLSGDGTPIGALRTGHNKAEVRRRAMETAF